MDIEKGKEYIYRIGGGSDKYFIIMECTSSSSPEQYFFREKRRGGLDDYKFVEALYEKSSQCQRLYNLRNFIAEYKGETPRGIVDKYPEEFI